MSSLLQFNGTIDTRGVHLQAYKAVPLKTPHNSENWRRHLAGAEPTPCATCNKTHPRLYTFVRKPRGMFGPWVLFRYNNETHAPDLSVPLSLAKLPRDAKPMPQHEAETYWHSS